MMLNTVRMLTQEDTINAYSDALNTINGNQHQTPLPSFLRVLAQEEFLEENNQDLKNNNNNDIILMPMATPIFVEVENQGS